MRPCARRVWYQWIRFQNVMNNPLCCRVLRNKGVGYSYEGGYLRSDLRGGSIKTFWVYFFWGHPQTMIFAGFRSPRSCRVWEKMLDEKKLFFTEISWSGWKLFEHFSRRKKYQHFLKFIWKNFEIYLGFFRRDFIDPPHAASQITTLTCFPS